MDRTWISRYGSGRPIDPTVRRGARGRHCSRDTHGARPRMRDNYNAGPRLSREGVAPCCVSSSSLQNILYRQFSSYHRVMDLSFVQTMLYRQFSSYHCVMNLSFVQNILYCQFSSYHRRHETVIVRARLKTCKSIIMWLDWLVG